MSTYTIAILGRAGADRCILSDCGTNGCDRADHMGRTVLIRVAGVVAGVDEVVNGSAWLCRDMVNGGWEPAGDSLDSWLSRAIMEVIDRHPHLRQAIVENAQDWRVHTVTVAADGGAS